MLRRGSRVRCAYRGYAIDDAFAGCGNGLLQLAQQAEADIVVAARRIEQLLVRAQRRAASVAPRRTRGGAPRTALLVEHACQRIARLAASERPLAGVADQVEQRDPVGGEAAHRRGVLAPIAAAERVV